MRIAWAIAAAAVACSSTLFAGEAQAEEDILDEAAAEEAFSMSAEDLDFGKTLDEDGADELPLDDKDMEDLEDFNVDDLSDLNLDEDI